MALPTMLDAQCLIIGLPEAGKTTFLAALWHVVETKNVDGALHTATYADDIEHLNAIRDAWLTVDPTPRTRQADKRVTMRLRDHDGRIINVELPDMAGETFLRHWTDRQWPQNYAETVNSSSGVLLFVHPAHVSPGPRVDQANELLGELSAPSGGQGDSPCGTEPAAPQEGGPVQSGSGGGASAAEELAWDPKLSPTEVILVDCLQMVMETAEQRGRLKVGLVVSAWDLVGNEGQTVDEWIATRLPLLYQFLSANEDLLEWRGFGVSAHGGDPFTQAESLRSIRRPHERIRVMGSEGSPHDITWPIRWLLT